MAWARFTAAYDYHVGRAIIAYPAGYEGPVKRDCLDKARALGRAVEMRSPRRETIPQPDLNHVDEPTVGGKA